MQLHSTNFFSRLEANRQQSMVERYVGYYAFSALRCAGTEVLGCNHSITFADVCHRS